MATFLRVLSRHYSLRNSCKNVKQHKGRAETYRKVSLGVIVPAIAGLSYYMISNKEDEEKETKFVPYEYLNIRTKRFPWGDGNTPLFYNPKKNKIPPYDQYEESEGNEDEDEDNGNEDSEG